MKTILLATDFSDAAFNAARYALSLSIQLNIERVLIYHSFNKLPIITEIPISEPYNSDHLEEECKEELNKLKEALNNQTNNSVVIEVLADHRSLDLAINQLASSYQVEFVVIGTSVKNQIERIFIGSNAVDLIRSTEYPLLIVPQSATYDDFNSMVYACDLKEVAQTVPVRMIKSWADNLQVRLLVVNVDYNDVGHFDPDTITEQYKLHELFGDTAELHYIDRKDLITGIIDFAQEHRAGMIFLVVRSYDFLERLFHRSISERLLWHVKLPLMFLKEIKR
ncbi:universal stress protein [Olivibacter sp. SDN3]|uniref:universal stress protein n=1 Tax=Olivibacter sp. SDN3 TaxID=2764720 RepID=UPI001651A8AB|nr:universal stress protein [Olivibacter sp. SDN3]QNL48890.1 universal stress protein [Olivibacter sp. SDN3]